MRGMESMLQKIKKSYNKLKTKRNQFRIAFYGFIIAIILFFVAHHNIDLMMNYAIIYNNLNQERDSDNYDIRKIMDCNGFRRCPDFITIYIRSNIILFASFFLMTIVSMGFMLEKWERKESR